MNIDRQEIKSADLLSAERPYDFTAHFLLFLSDFRLNDRNIYNSVSTTLSITLEHINLYDPHLFSHFIANPKDHIDTIEKKLKKKIYILSNQRVSSIRDLTSSNLNRIMRIRALVISISQLSKKIVSYYLSCKNCLRTEYLKNVPRYCTSECGLDPFLVLPEKSEIRDIQYLTVQEIFDEIPVGETGRQLSVEIRDPTLSIKPGEKIEITGFLERESLFSLGTKSFEEKQKNFTEEEVGIFHEYSNKNIYPLFVDSLAPQIHGNESIKKTLILQLFSNYYSNKKVRRRSFINVLLMGDPGIAKSQLLKAATSLSPLSVYTSGKGASAAGLTAAVLKNSQGHFYLEGGALVLADGGLCAIDEFEKMAVEDRVAIHEAMEQGTLSISKAGISTVLSASSCVLAAANPYYGRYDKMRTIEDNINMESSILSRFDAVFLLHDTVERERDHKLSQHVLKIHANYKSEDSPNKEILEVEFMQRYINYAKTFNPQLGDSARDLLKNFYVESRIQVSPLPITVRQLESLIRFSEAHARLHLREEVLLCDAEEAIAIFKASTLKSIKENPLHKNFETIKQVQALLNEKKTMGFDEVYSELEGKCTRENIKSAVEEMVRRGEIIEEEGGLLVNIV